MHLIVTGRDLKWHGKRLAQGQPFTATTERDLKLVGVLKKVGKVAEAPPKPVSRTATVMSHRKLEAEQPPPAPAAPFAPMSTEDAPEIAPRRQYQTRRLKAED